MCKAQFTKNISSKFTIIIEADESDEQPELLEAIFEDDKKEAPAETQDAENDDDSVMLSGYLEKQGDWVSGWRWRWVGNRRPPSLAKLGMSGRRWCRWTAWPTARHRTNPGSLRR